MQLVIPNSFSPNTVALSGLVDANFTQVATIVNSGIDYGNINTTSGTTPGLIASIFLPTTTAQGIFSATTAGVGYTFLAGSTTAVPLAITGVSSQNADLFDVNLVAAGTQVFKIDKIGQGSFTSGATGSTPLAVNMIASQSVDGLQVNGAASITGNILAAYLTSGGTLAMKLTGAGAFNVGSGAAATTAGDIGLARGATATGALQFGNGPVQFDYGVTTASVFTANAAFTTTGVLIGSSGVETGGSPDGYSAEFKFLGTGGGGSYALATIDTGTPLMYFDHRGASNTGGWVWRNNGTATTRMQLESGCLSIGSTAQNTGTAGDVCVSRSSTTGLIQIGGASAQTNLDYNMTNSGQLSVKGSSGYVPISAGAYTNASDSSLKQNVALLPAATPLILALKPVSFNWIESGAPGLGFLAQDVQPVLPDLVQTDNDGLMGVNYDGIIPVLVKGFQEMQAALHAAGVVGF